MSLHHLPYEIEKFETREIFKALTKASRALAELKGEVQVIPNESILVNTLGMQEAKESSAIENIITTQDDLYRSTVDDSFVNLAAKEVNNYSEALKFGYDTVRKRSVLMASDLKAIQGLLEPGRGDFRKVPGTVLKDSNGKVIYTPPQDAQEIVELLSNLEKYINDDSIIDLDPLVKMAIIHYQFESIHPFYDGNGRTGRIINILYLVLKGLLDIPVLYLSRYIIDNKADYYRLLQEVRDEDSWQEWIVWTLKGIEETALQTTDIVRNIRSLMTECKKMVREQTSFYSKELIDVLFLHPYTKIKFVEDALSVHRNTASVYLNELCNIGVLDKIKLGRSNYYVNKKLYGLLSGE